jgi:hypothetical protein
VPRRAFGELLATVRDHLVVRTKYWFKVYGGDLNGGRNRWFGG